MVEQKQIIEKPKSSLLKATREAQGLDIETVHEATKIPLDVLKAIEEGYTVRTLSPFYLKAFKKKYAEYLHLDINDVVEDYHPERLPKPMRTLREDEQRRISFQIPQVLTREHQQLIFKAVVVLLALVAVSRIFSCGHRSARSTEKHVKNVAKNKSADESAKAEVAVPVEEAKAQPASEAKSVSEGKAVSTGKSSSVGKPGKLASASKAALVSKPESESASQQSSRKITVQSPQAEPVLTVTPESAKKESSNESLPAGQAGLPDRQAGAQSAPVAPTKNVNLVVRARKSSWLQVKVDDTLVFQSTLSKGAVETWQADDAIELSGNNISELEFEVNGKVLGTLGHNDQHAHRVVITKSGLTVKK